MKNYFILAAIALLTVGGCAKKEASFALNGTVSGDAENKMVYLYTIYDQAPFDSTTIVNGKFAFTGTMETPQMVQLIIDNNAPQDKGNQKGWKKALFYLENSTIDFAADINSMDNFWWTPDAKVVEPTITGSKSNDLYLQYKNLVKNVGDKLDKVQEEYLKVYHIPAFSDTFNTEQGIALMREVTALRKEMNGLKKDFIRQNAASPVAFDLAKSYFEGMHIDITAPEIDELVAILRPSWQNTPPFAKFEEAAMSAKQIALGANYPDVEILNEKGETVKLSSCIKPGKYTLLEVWASWCGPCRGEIPHLKHVYAEFKDKDFDIVSVSLDENNADWEKAKKEENMPWMQLQEPENFDGDLAKSYRITGVPYAILIDKEGKIIATEMRGASLDAILKEKL